MQIFYPHLPALLNNPEGDVFMNITVIGRKCTPRDSFKERAEKKLAKLDKFFGDEATAKVTATVEKTSQTVEVTVNNNGILYRAQNKGNELNEALDGCIDLLVRQIRKNKTRLEKKLHTGAFDSLTAEPGEEPVEEETEFDVVRIKTITVKPQTVEEAILQMNMLGHSFYLFRNAADGNISLVYSREDGGYGLITPEDE